MADTIVIKIENGRKLLVGGWPKEAIINPEVLSELLVLPRRKLEVGVLALHSTRAQYIYRSALPNGDMICGLVG